MADTKSVRVLGGLRRITDDIQAVCFAKTAAHQRHVGTQLPNGV